MTATLTEEMTEVGSPDLDLSIEDLDLNLERIVRVHEGSERLICEYLVAIRERRGYGSCSGRKSRAESNSPPNLIAVCVFHHRMIHAATIGVKGRAPSELEWRRPALMEKVLRRNQVWQTCAKVESGSNGNSRTASGVFR